MSKFRTELLSLNSHLPTKLQTNDSNITIEMLKYIFSSSFVLEEAKMSFSELKLILGRYNSLIHTFDDKDEKTLLSVKNELTKLLKAVSSIIDDSKSDDYCRMFTLGALHNLLNPKSSIVPREPNNEEQIIVNRVIEFVKSNNTANDIKLVEGYVNKDGTHIGVVSTGSLTDVGEYLSDSYWIGMEFQHKDKYKTINDIVVALNEEDEDLNLELHKMFVENDRFHSDDMYSERNVEFDEDIL